MGKKLSTLIQQTEAAIGAENDPKKLRNLQANLATFTATRAEMDGDDGDDGDDGEDGKDGKDGKDGEDGEDGDDAKSKKAAAAAVKAKKAAEAAKHRAKAADHKQKAAEAEEAAKAAEADDEEDEDEARLRVMHPSASLSDGAQAAIASQNEITSAILADLKALKAEATARTHSALIADAVATRRVTKHEATTLAKKPLAFVRDFLEMRPKAIVNVDEDALAIPDGTPAADIPASVKALVEQGIVAMGLDPTSAAATKYRDQSYADQRNAASKGGAGVTH